MSTATAIAIRDDQVVFDELQRKALAHMGVEHATDADLAIFMHQCKRTGLDPFARQIHMIGRNTKNQRTQQWETKFTIQTGIDGYRLIARRAAGSAGYGYEETLWCGADGKWVDVWTSDESPHACKVVVERAGKRFPAIARYKAYVQTKRDGQPNSIWAQRDAEQLEKCAEALALRKAFPQDLSGIYTEDEMHATTAQPVETSEQPTAKVAASDFTADPVTPDEPVDAEEVPDEPTPEQPAPQLNARQRGKLFALFTQKGIAESEQLAGIAAIIQRPIESRTAMTSAEFDAVIARLEALPDAEVQE